MTRLRERFVQRSAWHLREDLFPKIETAVGLLSSEQLWWRPNENCNSVGNLLLHLAGNVRQWIIAGLGGADDRRDRDSEFSRREPMEPELLLSRLSEAIDGAIEVLRGLDDAALEKTYSIQVYEVTGVEAVLHVVEHFSYHTGQILYVVKMLEDRDLAFYDL